MITEQHELLQAYFTNDDRTIICALWVDPSTKEIVEEIIEAKSGDDAFEYLLKFTDTETIHEETTSYIKEQRNNIKDVIKDVLNDNPELAASAKESKEYDKKMFTNFIHYIFDKEFSKENLFMMKLALFELETIKQCANKPAKTKLRKAETPIEALNAAIEITRPDEDQNQ